MAEALDRNGIVVDIGRAFEVLKEVLAPLNYRNLDEVPAFKSINTTTEFLTRHVFDGLAAAVKRDALGRAPREIAAIRVTVAEIPRRRGRGMRSAVVAAAFAVPGSLDQPTGGYAYDRRVIAETAPARCAVEVIDLGDGFPRPTVEAARDALVRLQRVPAGGLIVIDGLALGVLPEAAQALRATHKVIALVHHRWRSKPGSRPKARQRCGRASRRRSRRCVTSSSQVRRRPACCAPITASPRTPSRLRCPAMIALRHTRARMQGP